MKYSLLILAISSLLCGSAFAQFNPLPTVSDPVNPQAVVPGSGGFSLTVHGAGFAPGAVVNWNGDARITTFISGGELQAQILASDVATAGSALITVTNPPPGGGLSSSSFAIIEIHSPTAKTVFSRPRSYAIHEGGLAVFAADFNADSKLDLLQVNNGFEVLLGNGDGTFVASSAVRLNNFDAPTGFSFGDFNGDGNFDLVFALIDKNNQVHVYLGDGTGKFRQLPGIGNFTNPEATAVGDFNRDGILDLVVTDVTGFYVLLGNGDGTFQPQQQNNSLQRPVSPVVADFNGDGILDLAFVDINLGEVAVLLGKGDGTFGAPIATSVGGAEGPLIVNDFNADGMLDVALEPANNQRQITILIGNGDGTFQSSQYFTGFTAVPSFTVGDFNSDGISDLLAYTLDGSVASLLLGNGDGTFQSSAHINLAGPKIEKGAAIVGDFNSDGLLDLGLGVGGTAMFVQHFQ